MIYDFFIKLMSTGLAAIIAFSPLIISYEGMNLTMQTTLSEPVTEEMLNLIEQGFELKILFYCSVIINDKKTIRTSFERSLKKKENLFIIDDKETSAEMINKKMGKVNFTFEGIELNNDDELLVFVKASIIEDEVFRKSTGMKTSILWEYYIPRIKKKFLVRNGAFVEKK